MLSDKLAFPATRRYWAGALLSGVFKLAAQGEKQKRPETGDGRVSVRMHTTPPVVIDGASFEITSEARLQNQTGSPTWVFPGFGVLKGVRVSSVNEKTGAYLPTFPFVCATGVKISIWLGRSPGSASGNPSVVVDSQRNELRIETNRPLSATHDRHANRRRKYQYSAPAASAGDWFRVEYIRLEGQAVTTLNLSARRGRLLPPDALQRARCIGW